MRDEPKTFVEHLGELRKRIIISVSSLTFFTIVSFMFRDRLFDYRTGILTLPLRLRPSDIMATFVSIVSRAGLGSSILNLIQLFFRSRTSQADTIRLFSAAPTEKFIVAFKVSFAVGALLAAPVILYQTWIFVLPALKKTEKRYLIPLFFIGLLFLCGSVFCVFCCYTCSDAGSGWSYTIYREPVASRILLLLHYSNHAGIWSGI